MGLEEKWPVKVVPYKQANGGILLSLKFPNCLQEQPHIPGIGLVQPEGYSYEILTREGGELLLHQERAPGQRCHQRFQKLFCRIPLSLKPPGPTAINGESEFRRMVLNTGTASEVGNVTMVMTSPSQVFLMIPLAAAL